MIAAAIIFLALVLVGTVLYIHHRLTLGKTSESGTAGDAVQPAAEEGCCGMHITCEKDSLVVGLDNRIEYYDDEELDRFAGRGADDYTPDEIEQFRDVLLTLLPDDIAGWGRSISMRGINLPSEVRDELLMIVAEARSNRALKSQPQ